MDKVSDDEIESIWRRIQKYTKVKKLKSKTREGLIEEINTQLRGAPENKNNQGSIQTLLNNGFAERLIKTQGIKKDLETGEIEEITQPRLFRQIPAIRVYGLSLQIPDKVKVKQYGKIGIKIKGKTRTYNGANIEILNSNYKGKPAYYIRSSRTGKRLTWGKY